MFRALFTALLFQMTALAFGSSVFGNSYGAMSAKRYAKVLSEAAARVNECEGWIKAFNAEWEKKTFAKAAEKTPEFNQKRVDFILNATLLKIVESVDRHHILVLPEFYSLMAKEIEDHFSSSFSFERADRSLKQIKEDLHRKVQELRDEVQKNIRQAAEEEYPKEIPAPRSTRGVRVTIDKGGWNPESWTKHIMGSLDTAISAAYREIWDATYVPIPMKIEADMKEVSPAFEIHFLADRIAVELLAGGRGAYFWRTNLRLPEAWYQVGHTRKFSTALRESIEAALRENFTYEHWKLFCDYEMNGYPAELESDLTYDDLVLSQLSSDERKGSARRPLVLNRWDDSVRMPDDRQVAQRALGLVPQISVLRQLENLLLIVRQQNLDWILLRADLRARNIKQISDILQEKDPQDALELIYLQMEEIELQLLRSKLIRSEIEKYETFFEDAEAHADNLVNYFSNKPEFVAKLADVPEGVPAASTVVASSPPNPIEKLEVGRTRKFLYHARFAKDFKREPSSSRRRRIALRIWRFQNLNHAGIIKALHDTGVPNLYELKMDTYRIYFKLDDDVVTLLHFGPKDTQLADVATTARLAKEMNGFVKEPEQATHLFDFDFQQVLERFDYPVK